MKVVTAFDSFKGSINSIEAGTVVSETLRELDPTIEVVVRPMADGGEGTVDALIAGLDGSYRKVVVSGPLGYDVEATYGIADIDGKKTAIMEMSSAAGLTLVPVEKRNPQITTTLGVGEMICDAIAMECRNFLIGIGGSATNDGGVGMLTALGYRFLDENGEPVARGALGLKDITTIDDSNVITELTECEFNIICDVKNPLFGPRGATVVYGPQKGARLEDLIEMDFWMKNYADVTQLYRLECDPETPGTGAAGGLGFAFQAFLGGKLQEGVSIIMDITNLARYVEDADVVISGEGCFDAQSAWGKTVGGVAKLTKHGMVNHLQIIDEECEIRGHRQVVEDSNVTEEGEHKNRKMVVLAGQVKLENGRVKGEVLDKSCENATVDNSQDINGGLYDVITSITPAGMSLEEAMKPEVAKENMRRTCKALFKDMIGECK